MSLIAKEWIIVLSFFLIIVGYTVAEAVWVNRKGWAYFGKSLVFSMLTNFIGYAVGFFVVFVIFGVILAMAWDGSIDKFPMKDYGLVAAMVFAALFTPTLLTVCKRVFLSLLKMQTGKSAWLYAVASAFLSVTVSVGVPFFLGFVFL